jgi:hypothetical protein
MNTQGVVMKFTSCFLTCVLAFQSIFASGDDPQTEQKYHVQAKNVLISEDAIFISIPNDAQIKFSAIHSDEEGIYILESEMIDTFVTQSKPIGEIADDIFGNVGDLVEKRIPYTHYWYCYRCDKRFPFRSQRDDHLANFECPGWKQGCRPRPKDYREPLKRTEPRR